MHEMTIARNILEIIYDTVESQDLSRVDSVELNVGLLSNVMNESLLFCFNTLVENTPLSSAKLVIKSKPIKIKCLDCGKISEGNDYIFSCSSCSGSRIEVEGGNELDISGILMKSP
jgi:hydrogenase nickel incorporation protein HypA/HybF